MVVCVNGVFGQRMTDVAQRAGAAVTTARAALGRGLRPEPAPRRAAKGPAQGAGHRPRRDLDRRLAAAGRARQAVPRIRHAAAASIPSRRWAACRWRSTPGSIDAVYSGTQKGLSCPPGLAPVSFSPRAVEAINRRKTKVQSWYLDMTMVQHYWGEERFYHHTAPITMIYALREALRLVLEEGLEARSARHLRNHQALKAGLAALGITYAAAEGHQLPQLNAVRIPAGVDDLTGAQAAAERVRHRDRRRPGRLQGQGLAHRPDGPRQPAEQRAAVPGGAGAVPASRRA